MKGHVGLFAFGLGVAAAGAFVFDKVRSGEINMGEIGDRMRDMSREVAREMGQARDSVVDMASHAASLMSIDINEASREDLRELGIPEELMDRVIEGRPYRNKLDLMTRMVVPQDLYDMIKAKIEVHRTDEDVKVA